MEEEEEAAPEMSVAAKKIVKICMSSISNIRAHNLKEFDKATSEAAAQQ
jgi:hypothetical protein